MTQAIGPTTQRRTVPYLSLDMLKYHQRRGVRFDDLVPMGRPDDQDAALMELIEEASAQADSIMLQTLVATLDTVLTRVNINNRGRVEVHPRYRPIIGVTAVALGTTPDLLTSLSSLSGVGVMDQSFSVPVGPITPLTSSQGPIQFGSVTAPMDRAWMRYTYCNGFPHTTLTAAPAAGATSISVADTTGIIQGATYLTIYAGRQRCTFLAGAVSTAPAAGQIGTGPGTVACAALPFAVDERAQYPTVVSAAPGDFLRAVRLLCRGIVKSDSAGNTSAATTTGNRQEKDPLGAGDDFEAAEILLQPYTVAVE